MKKIIIIFVLFIIFSDAYASEKAKVLIVPFHSMSEKDISFLTNSISEIINAKIGKDSLVEMYNGKESEFEKILSDVKKGNFDFIITGSIKISGKKYTLEGFLFSVKQVRKIVFLNKNGEGTGTIFVHINSFSDKILELGLKKEKEESSFIKIEKKNSWKSDEFDFEITSLNKCDYDGDGKNELVISSTNNIYIYKKEKDALKKLLDFDPDTNFKIYGVEAFDLNKNGKDEIFVTALNQDDNRLNSFVMEWDGKKFVKILDNQNFHYRLINSIGEQLLLTQEAGHAGNVSSEFDGMPYSEQLYKLIWDNGYKKIKLNRQKETNIYSFLNADINDNELKNSEISFEKNDNLKVTSKNGKVIWVSAEQLGGSDKYFKISSQDDRSRKEKVYFSQRLFFNDIDNDGNKELITVKNENQTTYLPNSRSYTKAGILVLSWGATGFETKFQSSKYSGYISDFYVGDIDNDGKKEIVYAVVTKDGFFGKKSAIYTYNLY